LSEATVDFLWARRRRIVEAGDEAPNRSERRKAQAREARTLWEGPYKKNKAFDEIRSTLGEMAPGHRFCMYCEYNHGRTIDHFCPIDHDPTRAFAWDNYLWSCGICNSEFKGPRFPLDRDGRPLLINPTRDDPREHLGFAPRYGKLVGRTPKGAATIEVLGFDRRGDLDATRLWAWRSVQRCLVDFHEACAGGDTVRSLEVQRDLCKHPHASLLSLLIEILQKPGGALLVAEKRCPAIIAAYPEIRDWV
jgi:uncharacterized protein (TIGR02646 family)